MEQMRLQVMREGTERAYSSLAFNDKGDMLASVGSYPDYLLTLWNWEEEAIVLRSKAFSQVRDHLCVLNSLQHSLVLKI